MLLEELETLLAATKKKVFTDDGELRDDVSIELLNYYESLLGKVEGQRTAKKNMERFSRSQGYDD